MLYECSQYLMIRALLYTSQKSFVSNMPMQGYSEQKRSIPSTLTRIWPILGHQPGSVMPPRRDALVGGV
eukprot:1146078-Pelagomonas_calceolata.AAC.2